MDPIPESHHRLAVWIGQVFHPYVICVPIGLLLLTPLPPCEALAWLLLLVTLILPPLLLIGVIQRRRGRALYQRSARTPVYLTFILSLLVGWGLLTAGNAPAILKACVLALLVWVPGQLLINRFVTKLSTHAAVVAGCASGLLVLGRVTPLSALLIGGVVLSTLWARVVTRHHTWSQVVLGALLGVLPVLLVFPATLRL